ncbi:MAG: phospho-N-acetylmuramoyl-pentapeptide-transferase [Lachnospiraceae bacterium]|nr:phospho-N-acetylmuramoyl-pentapeptide-transferase [Candidatus Merdinaster equi]
MQVFAKKLPHDQGREYAVDGALSKGKVRGVGLIFILVFALIDFLFNEYTNERMVYLAVIVLSMITGFLDDAAKKPWNEYLKGALDLGLAIIVAVNYLYFNGNEIYLGFLGQTKITIPYVLFGFIIVVLVWTAINVTNCTDGVDGLSATLGIITLGSFYLMFQSYANMRGFCYSVSIFIVVLVAYLWFNATPSSMLMGDAGSRAMGVMIAISALMCKAPLLYIPFSLVMIIDGGLGLIKVFIIRFFKIQVFKNTRFPLHDQARKVHGWSNTQVVFRFAIIQAMISAAFIMSFAFMG